MSVGEVASGVEVRRDLTSMERWCWIINQIFPHNVITRVRIDGVLGDDAMAAALDQLQNENWLLRVAIEANPDGTKPRFVEVPGTPIPTRVVVAERSDSKAWEREVNDVELREFVDWRSGPLLRVVHVKSGAGAEGDQWHDIILTVSHIIADGTTAFVLLRRLVQLLWWYQGNADGEDGRPADVNIDRADGSESWLPRRHIGVWGSLRERVFGVVNRALSRFRPPSRIVMDSMDQITVRETRFISRQIDSEYLTPLYSRCRDEGVTVHAALAAALAVATGKMVSPSTATWLNISSPVNCRSELVPAVPPEVVGCHAASVSAMARVGGPRSMWDVARQINREVRVRRRAGEHLNRMFVMNRTCPESLQDSERSVAHILRNGPGSICVSSMKEFEFPDVMGDWMLEGAQLVGAPSVHVTLLLTSNISQGVLQCNFSHVTNVISAEYAQALVDDAISMIENSVSAEVA